MRQEIFALDIGTRKVMGIFAVMEGELLEILDAEVIEHASRPMFDGQIHSINEVVKTVKAVKENLELRLQKNLTQVGVAVAGRNLITYRSRINKNFDFPQEVTDTMIRNLELEAVDKIISDTGSKLSQFYCVGYSPVYYELDGSRISKLTGHYAKSIAVEVIVTFLPQVVLNSMFSVLEKCKLEAINITLEPISAINAIIPPEMRNLNLVLVDVGAGTSDLALTKDGVVFAYGMVPEAGDEIMERISEILLTDFSASERIKRILNDSDSIEYEDIWGRRHCVETRSVKEALIPTVKKLADSIAKTGLDLNGVMPPQAVVLVGGGSLTFNLDKELAVSFGLSPDKAGIRLPGAIKGIKDRTGKLTGPEAVTPIGIAIMTAHSMGLRFINIEVNHKRLKVLDFQQKKDIMGALTLYDMLNKSRLFPRPGLALTVEVNGKLNIIKGTLGEPAKLLLNGKPVSSLSEKIEDGDSLEFEPAVDGQDGCSWVKDLVGAVEPIKIIFNGMGKHRMLSQPLKLHKEDPESANNSADEVSCQEELQLTPPVIMNGRQVGLETEVFDRANIEIAPLKIEDVLKFKNVKFDNMSERQILVNINGVPKILTQRNFTLRLNSQSANLNTEVKPNDVIEFFYETPSLYKIRDVVDVPDKPEWLRINVDGNDIVVELETVQVIMNGQRVKLDEFLIDGADIKVYYHNKRQILLSEIFRYIDFDTQRAIGKSMKFLVDEKPAGFITPLVEGSRVRIVLEER